MCFRISYVVSYTAPMSLSTSFHHRAQLMRPTSRHFNPCAESTALTRRVTTLSASSEISALHIIVRLNKSRRCNTTNRYYTIKCRKPLSLPLRVPSPSPLAQWCLSISSSRRRRMYVYFPPHHSTNLLPGILDELYVPGFLFEH